MSRVRILAPALAAAILLLTAQGAVAAAAPSSHSDATLLNVYERTGTIPPCRFTIAQLSHALRNIDTFDSVYFQDFPTAIKTALTQRSAGACTPGGTGSTTYGGAVPTSGAAAGLPSGPVTAGTGAPIPLPLLLLAILAVGFGAVAGTVALARAQGWDPEWAAAVRHTFSEAGFRLAGAWEEFSDWLRSGSRRS